MHDPWLLRHVVGGYTRRHPLRAAVSVFAIALGVALGYAVQLINSSALAEFSAAVRQVTGQADATLGGTDGAGGFDERLFDRVAADAAVEFANPVLEVDAVLVAPSRLRGRTLPIAGIDALRAVRLQSALVGVPSESVYADAYERRFAIFGPGVFLSPAALDALQLQPGDSVSVQVGARAVPLRVAGTLPAARAGHIVAAMDVAFAQSTFERAGRLTRIDLQLAAGTRIEALAQRLQLPPGVALAGADAAATRMSNLSRAYRVNLNVLALVALFTGSFLVYSLQLQSVAARFTQLAFLRVLGGTRRQVERLLLAESLLLGLAGAAVGVLLGIGIAALALDLLGADLGAGYFGAVGRRPELVFVPWQAGLFFALGVLAATVGGWRPARDAARATPVIALRAGAVPGAMAERGSRFAAWPGLVLLGACVALLTLPPVAGIPVFAYLAIAALLVAALWFKPFVAPALFVPLAGAVARGAGRGSTWIAAWLAAARLAAAPRFAAVGATGIVAAFALMVAMATMVASFRASVDAWLVRVLPADIYVRAAASSGSGLGTAAFSARDLDTLRTHPAVERAAFARSTRLVLDPARGGVALIAREIDRRNPGATLPLTGASAPVPAGAVPAWVSEAMVDLYGARAGGQLDLPLAGRVQRFFVAGVWRDYARQSGAIAIDLADYQRLTGDATRTEAQLWLRPEARGSAGANRVLRDLQGRLDAAGAEFAEAGELRAISLRIFDRSFAVTYVLELAAIVIGLTGIAATFSAQAIVRAREFGMLRHLGVTRGQILLLLAFEGLLVTLMAIVIGLVTGLAIAWILVDVVNPQSFHWTMDMTLPVGQLAALVAALLAAAGLTALIAGRRAVGANAVLAVREDW
jgi:putative ABC transport system permease protein